MVVGIRGCTPTKRDTPKVDMAGAMANPILLWFIAVVCDWGEAAKNKLGCSVIGNKVCTEKYW